MSDPEDRSDTLALLDKTTPNAANIAPSRDTTDPWDCFTIWEGECTPDHLWAQRCPTKGERHVIVGSEKASDKHSARAPEDK